MPTPTDTRPLATLAHGGIGGAPARAPLYDACTGTHASGQLATVG